MKVTDITNNLAFVNDEEYEYPVLVPFIHLMSERRRIKALWLEYCGLPEPDRHVLAQSTMAPAEQNFSDYRKLGHFDVVLNDKVYTTFTTRAHRIPGATTIGIVPLATGCLWTMIPTAK